MMEYEEERLAIRAESDGEYVGTERIVEEERGSRQRKAEMMQTPRRRESIDVRGDRARELFDGREIPMGKNCEITVNNREGLIVRSEDCRGRRTPGNPREGRKMAFPK
jgi:hypothetical protein